MEQLTFWLKSDRLGPDMPLTHLLLYFKASMKWICRKRFASFGEGSEFRAGSYAINTRKIWIGKSITIRPMSYLVADPRGEGGSITIEDGCLLGASLHIYTANHRYEDKSMGIIEQGHNQPECVLLKQGCWIGANVTILKGVTVGRNAVVGAGSVVTKDVKDYEVVAGVPARALK